MGALSVYRRVRNGLRAEAEISYYIDYLYHHRGSGKFLLTHLKKEGYRLKICHLIGIVLDINHASQGLLRSLGFTY